jgi:hypothetical protein
MRLLSLDHAFPVPHNSQNYRESGKLPRTSTAYRDDGHAKPVMIVFAGFNKFGPRLKPRLPRGPALIGPALIEPALIAPRRQRQCHSLPTRIDRLMAAAGPRLSGIVCWQTNMAIFHDVSEASFSGRMLRFGLPPRY